VALFIPSMSFAASWNSFPVDNYGDYTTQTFYNNGDPGISLWMNNNSESSRSYTIELEYRQPSGRWTVIDEQSGSIRGGSSKSIYFNTDTYYKGNMRYVITASSSLKYDGKVSYYR
jgi:hypothetical protein